MNVQLAGRPAPVSANASKLATADGDIHPGRNSNAELAPFLPKRWQEHYKEFGPAATSGLSGWAGLSEGTASGRAA